MIAPVTICWTQFGRPCCEQPIWMTIVLAAMLGQIGLPGGGFGIGYGSVNRMGASRSPAPTLNRPVGANPIRSFIPVARHRLRAPAMFRPWVVVRER